MSRYALLRGDPPSEPEEEEKTTSSDSTGTEVDTPYLVLPGGQRIAVFPQDITFQSYVTPEGDVVRELHCSARMVEHRIWRDVPDDVRAMHGTDLSDTIATYHAIRDLPAGYTGVQGFTSRPIRRVTGAEEHPCVEGCTGPVQRFTGPGTTGIGCPVGNSICNRDFLPSYPVGHMGAQMS